MDNNKKCILTNDKFSWFLEVDNEKIAFSGSHNADYFENHYKSLGYEIVRIERN